MNTYWNDGTALYHWGVQGMKWGVRRYRNYDGSLTRAGMERYNKSLDIYEKRKSKYDTIKKDKTASRYDKKIAKANVKEAKRQLRKDYKHLAQDKKADQGKVLYKQGYRITSNAELNRVAFSLASSAPIAAEWLKANGYIDTKTARIAEYASAGLAALTMAKNVLDEIPNSKLRAYYSHSSNY